MPHGAQLQETRTMSTILAYSVSEACKASGLGRTSIYTYINSGQLRCRKHGSRTLILESELRAFLERLPDHSPSPAQLLPIRRRSTARVRSPERASRPAPGRIGTREGMKWSSRCKRRTGAGRRRTNPTGANGKRQASRRGYSQLRRRARGCRPIQGSTHPMWGKFQCCMTSGRETGAVTGVGRSGPPLRRCAGGSVGGAPASVSARTCSTQVTWTSRTVLWRRRSRS